MKNKFSKIILPALLLVVALCIIGPSCGDSSIQLQTPSVPTCDSSNTLFKQLYNQTDLASSVSSQNLYDNQVYEYTFYVDSNRTICSVGLESTAANTSYTIEIYNKTDAIMAYTGAFVFNTGATDYKTITPTFLLAGKNYIIRRITATLAGSQTKGLGYASSSIFPVSLNGLIITSANLYDVNTIGSVTNKVLPFIDIVFQ